MTTGFLSVMGLLDLSVEELCLTSPHPEMSKQAVKMKPEERIIDSISQLF
jgi:hypothetical protein